jgi:hypothetical protein
MRCQEFYKSAMMVNLHCARQLPRNHRLIVQVIEMCNTHYGKRWWCYMTYGQGVSSDGLHHTSFEHKMSHVKYCGVMFIGGNSGAT